MSRGAHTFRQSDLTKAIKAAVKSGAKDFRVEVGEGKIVVCVGGTEGVNSDAKQPPSEWD